MQKRTDDSLYLCLRAGGFYAPAGRLLIVNDLGQVVATAPQSLAWIKEAAKEIAKSFSFGHTSDSYVTDEQRAEVAKCYEQIMFNALTAAT